MGTTKQERKLQGKTGQKKGKKEIWLLLIDRVNFHPTQFKSEEEALEFGSKYYPKCVLGAVRK